MLDLLFQPRLCELGKIKIGKKEERIRKAASGDWRAPMKIDHFLITTLQKNDRDDFVLDTDLMEELKKDHADSDGLIRSLPIYVLSNEVEDIQQSAWLWYKGRSMLAAKSDGKTLTKFYDFKTGRKLDEPEEAPWLKEYEVLTGSDGKRLFKLHTTFNCVVASKRARWGGVYKLRTTSEISGSQLYGSLLHVKQLTAGVLRGLPLSLVVRPVVVRPQGAAVTVYVVHVELRGADLHELQTKALEQKRYEVAHVTEMHRSEQQYRKMLRAPGEGEDATEIVEITDEFVPDLVAADTPAAPSQPDPLFGDAAVDEASSEDQNEHVTVGEGGEVIES